MGFDRAVVDISCDKCGLETEPSELDKLSRGRFSSESIKEDLVKNGWEVKDDFLKCPDCLFEWTDGGAV